MASRNSLEFGSASFAVPKIKTEYASPYASCRDVWSGWSRLVDRLHVSRLDRNYSRPESRPILIISETRYYTYECCPRWSSRNAVRHLHNFLSCRWTTRTDEIFRLSWQDMAQYRMFKWFKLFDYQHFRKTKKNLHFSSNLEFYIWLILKECVSVSSNKTKIDKDWRMNDINFPKNLFFINIAHS